jgi:hypothetical protein
MSTGALGVMPDFCSRKSPFHYATALIMLAKLGVDINQVDILAAGEFENYRGEVREQDPPAGAEFDSHTKITLKVGCLSAVDQTPYQFFYGLQGVGSPAEWEDKARALMAPYDAAVVRHEATAEYEDLKNSLGLVEYGFVRDLLSLFDFDPESGSESLEEALLWVSLFPAFHHWAGNPRLVCKALEALYGYGFEIRENVRREHIIPDSCRYHLGSRGDRLGAGMIMGRSFVDYDSGYELVISGVAPSEMAAFLPGGKKRKRIEQALAICMPSHLEHSIRVTTAGQKTQIGRTKKVSFLGYSSYIGSTRAGEMGPH